MIADGVGQEMVAVKVITEVVIVEAVTEVGVAVDVVAGAVIDAAEGIVTMTQELLLIAGIKESAFQ
jgi:hypothetical protein